MIFKRRDQGAAPPPPPEDETMLDRVRGGSRTVIGARTRVRGTLRGQGAVLVCGTLRGDVAVHGGLTVAPGALLQADVEVERARVGGRVEGAVRASGSVRIDSSGEVDGEIMTPVVDLRPGSVLRGRAAIAGFGTRGGARGARRPTSG
ncbi:MAG TPA: polymer-forming cytoskeletal protein [Dongiaceae bacterium]|nr:polymer-forming cytoskeletal protein [Dongiaceae bacterium]